MNNIIILGKNQEENEKNQRPAAANRALANRFMRGHKHFVLVRQLLIKFCAGSAGFDCKYFLITDMRASDVDVIDYFLARGKKKTS